jgi:hypothetical protein
MLLSSFEIVICGEKEMKFIGKHAVSFAALLVLLAVPVYAPWPMFGGYRAQVALKGDLTLTSFQGEPVKSAVLPIDVNFTSLVPSIIPKGEYGGVEFHGVAIGPDDRGFIKFDGILTFVLPNDKRISFWAKFVAEKPSEEVPEGIYSVEGIVSVTISEVTMPPDEITWVLMKGRVGEYVNATDDKTSEAFGFLVAHVKIGENNNWTKVNIVFSTEAPRIEETEEVSRSFYVVRLVNAEQTELNGGLTITGTWNVSMRTVSISKAEGDKATFTVTLTPIVEGAKGTLGATFTPSNIPWQTEGAWTLTIETFGEINGNIVFFHTKFAKPFEGGIPRSDFNKDRKVDILDCIKIAEAYDAKLGSSRYNLDFDLAPGTESVGPDFEIDIFDFLVVAREIGQEY